MHKLDLHRKRHEDVRQLVIRFIETHWGKPAELKIITGNSNRMKEIVSEVLREYGLIQQEGRPFDMNRGYIITWTEK